MMIERKYDVEFIVDHDTHQATESFILREGSQEQHLSLHNYSEIYRYPGLYEYIFINIFKGMSHQLIPDLMLDELAKAGQVPEDLSVLDFGAGSGLIGSQLHARGIRRIIGIDLFEASRNAINRDFPGVYQELLIDDLSSPTNVTRSVLEQFQSNALVCVSALNVIPAIAWRNVFNLIQPGGWIALNIVADAFQEHPDEKSKAGSNTLIRQLIDQKLLDVKVQKTYKHRRNSAGQPIFYTAVIGRKNGNIDLEMCQQHYCPVWC